MVYSCRGEVVYGGICADITATSSLGVSDQSETAIWGIGRGKIATQAQNLPIERAASSL